jgi:hypothetical protein
MALLLLFSSASGSRVLEESSAGVSEFVLRPEDKDGDIDNNAK